MPFKISGLVVANAMAKDQILRSRGQTNRIGLDEAKFGDCFSQRIRRKQRLFDRLPPQLLERELAGQFPI
jgi:hypothetical protein